MLAYAPLHVLLFGLPGDEPGPQCLVMTSGNLGGEPICFTDDDAVDRLAGLADGWLMHDRDDPGAVRRLRGTDRRRRRTAHPSLPRLRAAAGRASGVRAADTCRGRRPQEHAGRRRRQVRVAEPAHRRHGRPRHTVGVRLRRNVICANSPGSSPQVLVADAHPRYRSTAWAHRNADGRPVRYVQHHHAHIAAVMAEHGLDGIQQVLGLRVRRHRVRSRRRRLGR